MITIFKYPRTISELHRLINFLDFKMKEIEDPKRKKSREWLRLSYAVSNLYKEAKENSKKDNVDNNIHSKITNTLEKWMRANKVPQL